MKNILMTAFLSATILASGNAFALEGKHHGAMSEYRQEQLAKLPKDKQVLVKKSMEEGRAAFKDVKEQSKALRKEIHTILTAADFDKAAFLEKSKQLQVLHEKMETGRAERMANLASQLTAEERKIVFSRNPHHGKKLEEKTGEEK